MTKGENKNPNKDSKDKEKKIISSTKNTKNTNNSYFDTKRDIKNKCYPKSYDEPYDFTNGFNF
jgi:hypothetical protein